MTTQNLGVKCQKRVRDHTGYHHNRCPYWATMEHEGKKYCNRHDPVKRQKLADEKYKKYKEDLRAKRRLSRDLTEDIVTFLKKMYHGEAETLINRIKEELED